MIVPGDSGKVEVSLDTKNKRDKIHKIIRVHSNDPQNKLIQLHLLAMVIKKPDLPKNQ